MKNVNEKRGKKCLYNWANLKKIGDNFLIGIPAQINIRKKQSSISSMGSRWAKDNAPKRKFTTKRIGNKIIVIRIF